MGVNTLTLAYLLSILTLTLAAVLFIRKLDNWMQKPIDKPYQKKNCFYHRHEKRFLGFLILAVGHDYLIMSKVSLSDILTVRPDLNDKAKAPAHLKLKTQKVDYVLCDRKTASIICAIDLFDSDEVNPQYLSHCIGRSNLFRSADLPWIRIPIKDNYQVPSIKKLIHGTILQHEAELRIKQDEDKKHRDLNLERNAA